MSTTPPRCSDSRYPVGHPPPKHGGPDLAAIVAALAEDGQVVHVERIPARTARVRPPDRPFPEAMAGCVPAGGLWSHQAAAVDLARAGTSVAISTGTASGKSLCYQLPVAEAALSGGTALLLFPTKALAQDQLRSMGGLGGVGGVPGLVPATYDGDTDPSARALGPALGDGGAHQPRHAPRRRPPPPRAVGPVPRPVAVRGGRRAAHPPGDLRHPRGPRPAPAAAGVRPLSVGPDVRVLVGHHRPAGRTGGGPVRAARWRRWSTTGRPEASGCSCCGTRRWSTRWPAPGRRATASRPACWRGWWPAGRGPSPSPAAGGGPSWWRPRPAGGWRPCLWTARAWPS